MDDAKNMCFYVFQNIYHSEIALKNYCAKTYEYWIPRLGKHVFFKIFHQKTFISKAIYLYRAESMFRRKTRIV